MMRPSDWPKQPSVAFLGPKGTYTHAATVKFFSGSVQLLPCPSLEDIFQSVSEGRVQFGVAPVENSTEGSIVQTLDCLSAGGSHICGEVLLRIHHAFLVSDKTSPKSISKIFSHQQSLAQCREWLKVNYPQAEQVAVSSNAAAAKLAASEAGTAAIAGLTAAKIYGLTVVQQSIEDIQDNTTRFVVVSKEFSNTRTGCDKTSIMLSAHDEPGALFKALEPFNRFGVSLARLESRPSRREAWSYTFYLDLRGHLDDSNVKSALDELRKPALEVSVLGSYPRAETGKEDV